jgi:hypothetical protein
VRPSSNPSATKKKKNIDRNLMKRHRVIITLLGAGKALGIVYSSGF